MQRATARIGEVVVDLVSRDALLSRIRAALDASQAALAVTSVNLDHLHHFWSVEQALPSGSAGGLEWISLVDGHPVAHAVERRIGKHTTPTHSGSELLPVILRAAERDSCRIVLVGGSEETRERWTAALAERFEGIVAAGARGVDWAWLDTAGRGAELADWVAEQRADVVVVALGKPRQELWIRDHGARTGARLLLAFGSAADYVAGTASRPSPWAQRHGLEWAVRLVREPRRLWRRYLVTGPAAWLRLRRGLVVTDAGR